MKHFYLVICSLHQPALSPCASLCSTLQGLTPWVPENAGTVKLHSAWQHHFYLKLHIIIIDLEVWPPCYTPLQADSFFPEMSFQCLLCPHRDQNVTVIRCFEDHATLIKRPPDKYFFWFAYCPEKSSTSLGKYHITLIWKWASMFTNIQK